MENEDSMGTVYIINKFRVKKSSQNFECILIYQDKRTGFCFIKPLMHKNDSEIVMELFKIFTSYGPPKKVKINSCSKEMINSIQSDMQVLCPFYIEIVKSDFVDTKLQLHVVSKLHQWMTSSGTEQWEIGCCIVQRQINTEVSPGQSKSPHDLFFNKNDDIDSDASSDSEEELEGILDEDRINQYDKVIEVVTPHQQNQEVSLNENVALEDEETCINGKLDETNIEIKEEIVDEINTLSTNIQDYVHVFEDGISIKKIGFGNDHIDIKEEFVPENENKVV